MILEILGVAKQHLIIAAADASNSSLVKSGHADKLRGHTYMTSASGGGGSLYSTDMSKKWKDRLRDPALQVTNAGSRNLVCPQNSGIVRSSLTSTFCHSVLQHSSFILHSNFIIGRGPRGAVRCIREKRHGRRSTDGKRDTVVANM